MALLAVKLRVPDFETWHQMFSSMGSWRAEQGVTGGNVHQAKGDPNTVLILLHFANAEAAEAFAANPDLAENMRRGGIEGAPRFEVWEAVK